MEAAWHIRERCLDNCADLFQGPLTLYGTIRLVTGTILCRLIDDNQGRVNEIGRLREEKKNETKREQTAITLSIRNNSNYLQ